MLVSKNYIEMIIDPVERFLDSNIENGNIWYYVIGLVAIILYVLIF